MEVSLLLSLLAIFALLLVSAFFSASETALTASSRVRLHAQAKEGSKRAALVNKIRQKKDQLIGALMIGNNLVNILASALATGLLIKTFGDAGMVYATAVMTVLVVIFCEVLPKTYAIHHAESLAKQEVAHEHAGLVAPDQPRGFLAASRVAFVHHVVVQQRGGVHELDRGSDANVVRALVAAQLRRGEREHGTQPLATGIDQVMSQFRDGLDIRDGFIENDAIDRLHVVLHDVEQRLQAFRRGARFAKRDDYTQGRSFLFLCRLDDIPSGSGA